MNSEMIEAAARTWNGILRWIIDLGTSLAKFVDSFKANDHNKT